MARAKYQVLILPYHREGESVLYCVFKRSDMDAWQFIAGGGEDEDGSELASAKREAFEEAGISTSCRFFPLETLCSIPAECFPKARAVWGEECLVIPEYSFAVELENKELCISNEHTEYCWADYETARELLRYDSNKTALFELENKLKLGLIKTEQTKMDISNLLACPRCGGELGQDCKCLACGSEYERRMGVYSILYEDMGEDYGFSAWSFDESDIQKSADEYRAFREEYQSRLTNGCRKAERMLDEAVQEHVESCRGIALDIATGRGMLLSRVMEWNPELSLIGTDIDARILAVTKLVRNCGENVAFVGCDGRHIALKDESVDHAFSFVGIANMPEPEKVISEIYRILKKGGSFIYKGLFMDRESEGMRDLQERFGLGRVMDIELLTALFVDAGFKVVRSEIIASGVWGENPYDRYPFAGENCNYGLIVVEK